MEAIGYLVGAGSMSLGVESAGYKLREVWETPGYGKNARTWDQNRPNQKVQILPLDPENTSHFKERVGSGVDLVYGNPPCGGLSSMTGSHLSSKTNNCMQEWIRMVAPARPRMILMENAYQLATKRATPLLNDLTGVLDAHGYYWWTWLFYSWQIGTPQIRRRMFLCGTLDQPRHTEFISLQDLPTDESVGACGKYLEDLVDVAPSDDPITLSDGRVITQHGYGGARQADRWNELIPHHRDRMFTHYYSPKDWEQLKAKAEKGDKFACRAIEKHEDRLWVECPKEFTGFCSHRPCVIDPARPAPAIIGIYKYTHWQADRVLTMREMARLMGYPDTWNFHSLKPHLIAQGIPVNSARWASSRMARVIGLKA
jgi:DNA (cytosine-5)-methyltransferase 1